MTVRIRADGSCRLLTLLLSLGTSMALAVPASAQSRDCATDLFTGLIIANCGFESGFMGWIPADIVPPTFPLSPVPAGVPGPDPLFFLTAPTQGMTAAAHGFSGGPPPGGLIRLAQDVPTLGDLNGSGVSFIEFDYRVAWDLTFPPPTVTLPRFFELNVEPLGGGPPLQSTIVLTAPVMTRVNDTGPQTARVDVKAFGGAAVRLSFDAIIPEGNAPPAFGFLQLDNVQVHPPTPLHGDELIAVTGLVSGKLIAVDTSTGAGWLRLRVGQFGPVSAIDFRDDGVLFAANGGGAANILVIDPNYSTIGPPETVIGNFSTGVVTALEFVGNVLYGSYQLTPTGIADLVTVDQTTGALTTIGSIGFSKVAGLAYDTANSVMYGVTSGAQGGDLITVNLATGAGSLVGPSGFTHLTALEFAPDGTLYAGIGQAAALNPGWLITVNPATGVGTPVGDTTFSGISGLSLFPFIFTDGFESGDTSAWSHSVP